MKTIPKLIGVVLFLALGAAIGQPLRAETTRPNVVVILIDDMGWADLCCYGSTYYQSPHIDSLATGGMRFTDAYAACPVCSPTRAALLTGKWPARLHLTDWLPGRRDMPAQKLLRPEINQQLPLEEVTLAEALQAAGYATASIGKWHLGGAGFGPEQQGFQLNIAGNDRGSPPGYFAGAESTGKQKRPAIASLPGLQDVKEGEYLTDVLSAAAVKFIDENRTRPFFLYLPHFAVHIPLQAKEELVKMHPQITAPPGKQTNPIYAAMIDSVDEGVGRILQKLDELKLTERTIVIFTTDNGGLATLEGPHTPATSNAPLREGKGFLYEGGIRVPMLVKYPPAVKQGSLSHVPVCTVDLLPTILDLCGIKPAAVDGVSLKPLLEQTGELEREALYWHYPHYANQGGKPGGVVRSGDWKLIEFYENGRRELFNVKTDMRESKNLAEAEPERVAKLAKLLEQWRKHVGAQLNQPNPAYSPNPQAADGVVTLPAKWAEVHGVQLRYEPVPHKNTLGYWTRAEDWASFEFDLKTPGEFDVELLVGCGRGSGGSEVAVAVGEQTLTFTVEETGGFQTFVPRTIGRLKLKQPGRHTLTVKPQRKPGLAVMDLRQVRLVPVEQR